MTLTTFEFKPPGEDAWYLYDEEPLLDLTGSELDGYEREMGFSVASMLHELSTGGARAQRAAMWIALCRAGKRREWEQFDPPTLRVEYRQPESGDADPPAPPAPSPDSSADSASGTSSSPSPPG